MHTIHSGTSGQKFSAKPIQARASFYVDAFMDAPTESQAVSLAPGEERDIPLLAVFNDRLDHGTQLTVRDARVEVRVAPAEAYDDRAQTRVVFQGKNAWDGTAASLRYFVTPDDPAILRYTRDVLLRPQRYSCKRVPETGFVSQGRGADKLIYGKPLVCRRSETECRVCSISSREPPASRKGLR